MINFLRIIFSIFLYHYFLLANTVFASNNQSKIAEVTSNNHKESPFIDQRLEQDIIIARVNKNIITLFDVKNRYFIAKEISKINIKNSEEERVIFRQLIDKMIEEEIIKQIAEDLKISISQQEIDNQIDAENIALDENSRKFVNNIIKNNKILFKSYKKQLINHMLWTRIIEYNLKKNIKISDSEIIEWMEQAKVNINNQKISLEQITIAFGNNKQDSYKLINKIYQQLKIGGNFNEINRQFSSENMINNDINWVWLNDLDQKIIDEIKDLKKGEYSQIIEIDDSYHIFRLIDKKDYKELIDDNQQQQVYNIIFNNKINAMARHYLNDLKKRAFIEIINIDYNKLIKSHYE